MNSKRYKEQVLEGVLVDYWAKMKEEREDLMFQQDGAPAHRSRYTVACLCSLVPEFTELENWPPNSPDSIR